MADQIESVAIVGCGMMGSAIAETCAIAGLRTIAITATGRDPAAARAHVLTSLDRARDKGKLDDAQRESAEAQLTFTNDLAAASDTDAVIESAAESLLTKRALFADLERIGPSARVLASNTSALRLSAIAEVLDRPERMLGLHFFSPATVMKLVEVAPTERTEASALASAVALCERIGKTPIVLSDEPGYIVNRLLVPYILYGIETLEAKLAAPTSIDLAMKLGCAHPMGPLELADYIGLDVVFEMAKSLFEAHGDSRYRPPSLLRRLVLSGKLGRKTKIGFYDYSQSPPSVNTDVFAFDSPTAS